MILTGCVLLGIALFLGGVVAGLHLSEIIEER
jgi:hypothetical protein